jgi:hypothetical protein
MRKRKKFVRSLPVFGFGFPGRTTHSRELPRPDGPAGAHWDSTDLFSPLEAVCHATLPSFVALFQGSAAFPDLWQVLDAVCPPLAAKKSRAKRR